MLKLILLTGCNNDEGGFSEMEEARIQEIMNKLISDEITIDDYRLLDATLRSAAFRRVIMDTEITFSDTWLESERQRIVKLRSNDLDYILNSSFFPQLDIDNVDLQTIHRFIFRNGFDGSVHGLVIDRKNDRAFYEQINPMFYRNLQFASYSAQLTCGDLDKLIQATQDSNLLQWQERYEGRVDPNIRGNHDSWTIGILFTDGTVLRRSGSGLSMDNAGIFPPEDEWDVMLDFVRALGQEIIERHAAENPQTDE